MIFVITDRYPGCTRDDAIIVGNGNDDDDDDDDDDAGDAGDGKEERNKMRA